MLICSFPTLRPNDFVSLFVFGGEDEESAAWKGAPWRCARGGRRAFGAPGLYRGGAAPANPPVFFCLIFEGAVLGSLWSILGPISAELDHN